MFDVQDTEDDRSTIQPPKRWILSAAATVFYVSLLLSFDSEINAAYAVCLGLMALVVSVLAGMFYLREHAGKPDLPRRHDQRRADSPSPALEPENPRSRAGIFFYDYCSASLAFL